MVRVPVTCLPPMSTAKEFIRRASPSWPRDVWKSYSRMSAGKYTRVCLDMTPSATVPVLLGGQAVRPQGPPLWPLADPDVFEALQKAYHDGSWGRYHGPNI